jgi:hypothetical protein
VPPFSARGTALWITLFWRHQDAGCTCLWALPSSSSCKRSRQTFRLRARLASSVVPRSRTSWARSARGRGERHVTHCAFCLHVVAALTSTTCAFVAFVAPCSPPGRLCPEATVQPQPCTRGAFVRTEQILQPHLHSRFYHPRACIAPLSHADTSSLAVPSRQWNGHSVRRRHLLLGRQSHFECGMRDLPVGPRLCAGCVSARAVLSREVRSHSRSKEQRVQRSVQRWSLLP